MPNVIELYYKLAKTLVQLGKETKKRPISPPVIEPVAWKELQLEQSQVLSTTLQFSTRDKFN